MINILLNGCNGKMGQTITTTAKKCTDIKIIAGISTSAEQKSDYPVFSSVFDCDLEFDAIIDFSKPESLANLLKFAQEKNKPLMIATTGFGEAQKQDIITASKNIPILLSANTSVGVNLLVEILKLITPKLSESFDIEIVEKHHNHKIDSPSGTSLLFANTINDLIGNYNYVYGRDKNTGKRTKNEIGIHSIRGGTYPGEHSVIFAGNDEILEITHTALSKNVFAEGTFTAVRALIQKPAGLYSMSDIF